MIDRIAREAMAAAAEMRGDEAVRSESQAEMIGMLRRALARVESGETIAIAVAEVHAGGSVATTYDLSGADAMPLISAVAILQSRLILDLTEES